MMGKSAKTALKMRHVHSYLAWCLALTVLLHKILPCSPHPSLKFRSDMDGQTPDEELSPGTKVKEVSSAKPVTEKGQSSTIAPVSTTTTTTPLPSKETMTDPPPEPADPLKLTCNKIPPNRTETPLKCYHCSSNTKHETDPECDANLWGYLKPHQITRYRRTCDQLVGKFCIKIVKERFTERITERGCFTDLIKGPNDTIIPVQNACIKFTKDRYIVTACFCDKSWCNAGRGLDSDKRILFAFATPSLFLPFVWNMFS